MRYTLTINNATATINNGSRETRYAIEALAVGDNTRRVLGVSAQYAATGARGAAYLLQTFEDGTFRLLSMSGIASGRGVYGTLAAPVVVPEWPCENCGAEGAEAVEHDGSTYRLCGRCHVEDVAAEEHFSGEPTAAVFDVDGFRVSPTLRAADAEGWLHDMIAETWGDDVRVTGAGDLGWFDVVDEDGDRVAEYQIASVTS